MEDGLVSGVQDKVSLGRKAFTLNTQGWLAAGAGVNLLSAEEEDVELNCPNLWRRLEKFKPLLHEMCLKVSFL